jgi:hypothetical protein
MKIVNADEVAAILRIGKRQVYELAKEKKENKNPLPASVFARLCASAGAMFMGGLRGWLRRPRETVLVHST